MAAAHVGTVGTPQYTQSSSIVAGPAAGAAFAAASARCQPHLQQAGLQGHLRASKSTCQPPTRRLLQPSASENTPRTIPQLLLVQAGRCLFTTSPRLRTGASVCRAHPLPAETKPWQGCLRLRDLSTRADPRVAAKALAAAATALAGGAGGGGTRLPLVAAPARSRHQADVTATCDTASRCPAPQREQGSAG